MSICSTGLKYHGFIHVDAIEYAESLLRLSSEKLNMLDIYNHTFDNGSRIVRLYGDGLVIYGCDWSLDPFETDDKRFDNGNYTLRLNNLAEGNPNKTKLENTNFAVMIKHPFGLVELIRREPYLYMEQINEGSKYVEYRSIMFNRRGGILFDNISNMPDEGCCFDGELDYLEEISEMRTKIAKEILSNKIDMAELNSLIADGKFKYTSDRVLGMGLSSYMREMDKLLGFHIHKVGENIIIYIGYINDVCDMFIMLNNKGEVIEHGLNTVIIDNNALLGCIRTNINIRESMSNKLVVVVEDGVIAVNTKSGKYNKISVKVPETIYGVDSMVSNRKSMLTKDLMVKLLGL